MKSHKHAELIKAWADGAEIQKCVGHEEWWDDANPEWHPLVGYRIKPQETKPDVVIYPHRVTVLESNGMLKEYPTSRSLKLSYCGETGKLKSAEVL